MTTSTTMHGHAGSRGPDDLAAVMPIVEAMFDGVVITDLELRTVMANEAALKRFGRTPEEVLGRPSYEFIPEEQVPRALERLSEAVRDGAVRNAEFTGIAKSGERFPISVNVTLLRDAQDRPERLLLAFKDMTAVRQAQEERIAALQEVAAIAEGMNDGLIVTDLDGMIVSYNRVMEEQFAGYRVNLKQLIGRPAADWPGIRAEDTDKYLELMRRTVEEGKAGPLEMRDKAGRWFSFTTSLLTRANGNPKGMFAVVRDISTLKRAEEDRIAAMQEAATIAQTMSEGLIVTDLEGNVVSFNRAMREHLKEYGRDPNELIGKPAIELPSVKPEDVETYLSLMEQTVQNGTGGPVEFVNKAGRWSSVTTGLLHDTGGNPRAVFALTRDVSKLKQAEAERARATAMQERAAIVDAMGDGVVLSDMEGKITDANPALEELTGYDKDEMVGRYIAELAAQWLTPKDVEKALESLKSILGGQTVGGVHLTLIRKNGSEVPIAFTSSFRTDVAGNPIALISTVKDMTEIKRAQERENELVATLERTRIAGMITEAMADAVVLADGEGTILAANPAIERMAGHARTDIVGKNLGEVLPVWVKSDDVERAMTMLAAALAGEGFGPTRFMCPRKDGTEGPVLVSLSFIRDAEGRPTHMIATVKDISELERLQENEKEAATLMTMAGIIGAMGDGLVTFDMDGKITSVNPAIETMTGYTSSELVGHEAAELTIEKVSPEGVEASLEALKSVLAGHGRGAASLTLIAKDGHQIPVVMTTTLRKDTAGNPVCFVTTIKDMTELARAQEKEKELAATVARTRMAATVLDAVSDSVLLAGIDGTAIAINPAFEIGSGYTRDEIVGKDLAEIMTLFLKPTDLERATTMLAAALAGEAFGPARFTRLRKDGTEGPVLVSLSFIRDAEGRPTHLIATIKDISELDRLQKAEKEAEALRAVGDVISAMADGVVLIDMEGRIISVNPAYERVTGKRASEVVGRDVSELIPIVLKPEDVEGAMNALGVALREGLSRPVTATFLREEGREVPMAFTASLVNDAKGRPQHLVVVAKDITELRRAQEKETVLAAEVARTQMAATVVEAMGDAVLLATIDGTVIAVNPAMECMMGYARDTLVGKGIGDILPVLLRGEDLERGMTVFAAALAGQDLGPTRFIYTTKDGRESPALASLSFIRGAEGKPTHMIATVRDIGELERLQEKEKEAAALRITADVVEGMADGVVLVDMDGTLVSVNPAHEKLTGGRSSEFVGRNVSELIAGSVKPEDVERAMDAFGIAVQEGLSAPIVVTLLKQDGTQVPLAYTASLVKDAEGQPRYLVAVGKDMTELRRAQEKEKELAAEVARTQMAGMVMDAMTDAILLLTMDGTVIAVNPAFEHTTGYTEDDFVGKNMVELLSVLFTGSEMERAMTSLVAATAGEGFGPARFSYLRKDGQHGAALVSVSFITDAEGKPTHMVGAIKDVAELERLEEKEKEADALQYVADVLDCMPDPVWLLDLDGTVTYANPASAMSPEMAASGAVGQDAITLALKGVAPEDMDRLMPRMLNMQKGEISPTPLLLTLLMADGRRVPTLMTSGFVRDVQGRPKGIITVAKDVTELKEAEENVRQSEDRYRRLLGSVTDYICSVTVENGRAVSTSHAPSCVAVTGYTPQEYQADPSLWYRMIHEADRQAVKEHAEAILLGKDIAPVEHRIVHKDGSVRWISNTPVVRKGEDGQVASYDALITDITKRKLAEEELKKAHELLEHRVAERTKELLDANRQIRQAQADLVQAEKMGMLGQLVAGVAHEINTPTGAIMNVAADSTEHLRELAAAAMNVLELPAEARRWLAETIPHVLSQETVVSEIADRETRREIEHELRRQGIADCRRMAEVMAACGLKVSDSLAVRSLAQEPVLVFLEHLASLKTSSEICHASVQKIARIVKALRYYSRSGEGEMFDINVNESIDNTLVILQNRVKHVAVVERRYQESLPAVRLGPDISQVWTNILSNACDAVEGAGGKQMGLIRIATMVKGENLIVEIFNEGAPIPQELTAKIFDPFFTTKPIGNGTGLGLSICTGILGKYGATVAVRNDPGGVTFLVSLPLALPDPVDTTRRAGGTLEAAAARTTSRGDRQ